ncbi:MAG: IS630 family transposase [Acidimicrobiia bacterium]
MSLSEQDRTELRAVLRSDVYDGSVASRAQIVLWYDEGHRKVEIVRMSGASRPTVDKWIQRFEQFGMEGLVDRESPGGPRQIPDRIRSRVLALSRTTPPSTWGISHWSSTEMAWYIKKTEGVYVSQTWVSRLWRENGLRPWRQGTFKISKDPDFEDKVRDVCDLSLSPPEGEVVVSVDAKSGIQALNRTQPMLPIDFGKTQKRTFDYVRKGTTDLYAALDIRTGKVLTSLSPTHATPDFLRLMKKVVSAYPDQKIHVVLDNASVHLSDDTDEWLARQNGNVVFHFTPTGASWMNMIEIWNGILTRKLVRCGTFSSVKILNKEIEAFVAHWNSDCQPITWTATAEEILDKVRAITSHMDALLRATEIDNVARQAA